MLVVECTESVKEREVLLKIEKNVYHRKTASPVVITKVSLLTFNHYFKALQRQLLVNGMV